MSGQQQKRRRRQFGSVRQLPSKRWQASYKHEGRSHTAPTTFATSSDASAYLSKVETDLHEGQWVSPQAGRVSFATYSDRWFVEQSHLRPRTQELYEGLLRLHIIPTFGQVELKKITPAAVRSWISELAAQHQSTSAKAYRLLKQILGTAVDDDLIARNPCRVKGAGTERPAERPLFTVDDVLRLTQAMRDDLRLALVLEVWVGLRRGEILGLQRRDIDLDRGTVRVERAVFEVSGKRPQLGPPKTDAGRRNEYVPSAFLSQIEHHLDCYTGPDDESFLFESKVGGPMRAGTLHRAWAKARKETGLTGFTFHDGRHFHLTTYGGLGATEAEILARGGHSSRSASRIYQHSNPAREEMLAEALSQISELRSVDLGFTTRSDEKSHGSRTTAMTEGPDPGAADAEALVSTGAGDGNRTRVLSLGSAGQGFWITVSVGIPGRSK